MSSSSLFDLETVPEEKKRPQKESKFLYKKVMQS